MILYHTEPDSPVIEISVEGKITDHDLREAIERMRGDLELNGKTRVLERIEHFTGIEPKALWTDITLGVSVARKVTRAAVVADAGWIRASTHLARFSRMAAHDPEPSFWSPCWQRPLSNSERTSVRITSAVRALAADGSRAAIMHSLRSANGISVKSPASV
ncbi:SpoIIAA-like [Paraburkholderia hospita]|nr:STAS/SEC14 domain-containing protein [Paraburkholderia hospita]SKC64255.1 SpoIIAA-like [Paraburkholderia hospita]